jgi:hypothetical protein
MRSQTRISKRIVDGLQSSGPKAILWDAELKGFGVAASAGGTKSYILNWRGPDGRSRRFTLGQHGKITADQARVLAKKRLGEIADGADPLAERRAERDAVKTTFETIAEEFIAKHVSKQRSALETERVVRRYLIQRFKSRPIAGKNLLPSVDRIDSDGHYELGNLQLVCQFINFWKGSGNNEEFRRLLMLVRGEDDAA